MRKMFKYVVYVLYLTVQSGRSRILETREEHGHKYVGYIISFFVSWLFILTLVQISFISSFLTNRLLFLIAYFASLIGSNFIYRQAFSIAQFKEIIENYDANFPSNKKKKMRLSTIFFLYVFFFIILSCIINSV